MTSNAELACVYSALILVDDDVAVTVSKNEVFRRSGHNLNCLLQGKSAFIFGFLTHPSPKVNYFYSSKVTLRYGFDIYWDICMFGS